MPRSDGLGEGPSGLRDFPLTRTLARRAMDAPLERRVPLAHLPTPVVPLDRLAAHLGMRAGALLAKLDDATGLAAGGNKVRKLEYLCAEALALGCDTLVTGGGVQSNHARLTAAAARRLGLECTLVLGGACQPAVGNLVLDRVLGADIRAVEAVLQAEDSGPVLLHCASSNRVGGVWTAIRVREGAAWAEAEAEGKEAGLRSPNVLEAVRRAVAE